MNIPKILITDDASFMRNLLGNILKDAGYQDIHFAIDGQDAIDKAAAIKPDIITLDISMPGMDGLKAIKKILEVSPDSKIIMVSAVTNQYTIKQAIQDGAVDFVSKPFDRTEIESVIKRHSV